MARGISKEARTHGRFSKLPLKAELISARHRYGLKVKTVIQIAHRTMANNCGEVWNISQHCALAAWTSMEPTQIVAKVRAPQKATKKTLLKINESPSEQAADNSPHHACPAVCLARLRLCGAFRLESGMRVPSLQLSDASGGATLLLRCCAELCSWLRSTPLPKSKCNNSKPTSNGCAVNSPTAFRARPNTGKPKYRARVCVFLYFVY